MFHSSYWYHLSHFSVGLDVCGGFDIKSNSHFDFWLHVKSTLWFLLSFQVVPWWIFISPSIANVYRELFICCFIDSLCRAPATCWYLPCAFVTCCRVVTFVVCYAAADSAKVRISTGSGVIKLRSWENRLSQHLENFHPIFDFMSNPVGTQKIFA